MTLALAAFGGAALARTPPPETPAALLEGALAQLRAAESFRLRIEQTGTPYPLELAIEGLPTLRAPLNSAEAQAIPPDELFISAQLKAFFLTVSFDIYALGARQWLSFPSGASWRALNASDSFNVASLLAADDGIEAVFDNLRELQQLPPEQEPPPTDDAAASDELALIKLRALADGEAIAALLFNLIEAQGEVLVYVYISEADGRLTRIDLTMLEEDAAADAEPSLWHIHFYDYDADRGFEAPA